MKTFFRLNFYWDFDLKTPIPLYLTFSPIYIDIHLC